jgi:hypothetical protein
LALQRRSPFAQTFMVQLNHAYLGYLHTPRHFELGGDSTWPGTYCLEAQASVKTVDHLLEMAKELKPGRDSVRIEKREVRIATLAAVCWTPT